MKERCGVSLNDGEMIESIGERGLVFVNRIPVISVLEVRVTVFFPKNNFALNT
jgi:hypothetical protein